MRQSVIYAILITVLCMCLAPLSAQAGSDPASIVNEFYGQYIKDHSGVDKALEKWKDRFDDRFRNELLEAMKKTPENNNCLWLEFDPFTQAQVPASSHTMGKATVKENKSSVIVYLTYKRGGKGYVTVQLERKDGAWKMTDFIDDENHSVYKILRHINRKE